MWIEWLLVYTKSFLLKKLVPENGAPHLKRVQPPTEVRLPVAQSAFLILKSKVSFESEWGNWEHKHIVNTVNVVTFWRWYSGLIGFAQNSWTIFTLNHDVKTHSNAMYKNTLYIPNDWNLIFLWEKTAEVF